MHMVACCPPAARALWSKSGPCLRQSDGPLAGTYSYQCSYSQYCSDSESEPGQGMHKFRGPKRDNLRVGPAPARAGS